MTIQLLNIFLTPRGNGVVLTLVVADEPVPAAETRLS